MKNLTSLEVKVLTAYKEAGTEATGAEDAEWMKADNFTFQTADEIADRTGLDLKTVKGVIGSLVKKGLLATEKIGKEENQALTDDGIDAAFYSERINGWRLVLHTSRTNELAGKKWFLKDGGDIINPETTDNPGEARLFNSWGEADDFRSHIYLAAKSGVYPEGWGWEIEPRLL